MLGYKWEIITESGLRHVLRALSKESAIRQFKNRFYGERVSVCHMI